MASFTFGFGHPFPAGTTVECYPDVGQKANKEPSVVAPVTSAAVQSNGTLTFTGLVAGQAYYAVAFLAGRWTWVAFRTAGEPELPGAGDFATGEDLIALENIRLASGKGFVNHGATGTTPRPSGYASIEWVGSVEPVNAANGDTWVNTT